MLFKGKITLLDLETQSLAIVSSDKTKHFFSFAHNHLEKVLYSVAYRYEILVRVDSVGLIEEISRVVEI